jgi:glutamate decarboxylase
MSPASLANYRCVPQLIDKLVADIVRLSPSDSLVELTFKSELRNKMEITESLIEQDSPLQALNLLSLHTGKQHSHQDGKMDIGSGSESSGTYAKTC